MRQYFGQFLEVFGQNYVQRIGQKNVIYCPVFCLEIYFIMEVLPNVRAYKDKTAMYPFLKAGITMRSPGW